MAVRKFIDETGLALLNTLLTNKFNTKYEKLSTGIPKSDLDSNVQNSLEKADTALQSHLSAGTGITISNNKINVTYGTEDNTACKGNDSRLSNSRTPTSHASTGTTYGVGTTTSYGHCKVINNLTTSSASDGNALQAYQGYVLNNNKQAKITYSTTDLTAGSSNLATGEFYAVYE